MDAKSYFGSIVSEFDLRAFFIESPLWALCGTRTDNPNGLAFLGVTDDEQALPRRYADREEPPLGAGVGWIRKGS